MVIACFFFVHHDHVFILFDPVSTYSNISIYYNHRLVLFSKLFPIPICVSAHMGDSLVENQVYMPYVVSILVCDTWTEPIMLIILNFM